MTYVRSPISILIADDHPLVRKSLQRLLSTEVDIEVVGEAQSGSEALRMAGELEPDVMVLDIVLPDKDGLSVLRELAGWAKAPRVIVCSFWEHFQEQTLAEGAAAFVGKARAAQKLVPTVRSLTHSGPLGRDKA